MLGMKTTGGRGLIFACCLSLVGALSACAKDPEPDERLMEAVRQFGRAYRAADVATLRSLLVPEYVHVNGASGSRMGRDEWLSWVASQRRLMDDGKLRIESYEISDVQTQHYGNTAIVTGTVRSEGIRNGEPFRVHVRVTNVWIDSEGHWRRAAFHDSSVPDSTAERSSPQGEAVP
jgi:ketosteroid isomerase-like protein